MDDDQAVGRKKRDTTIKSRQLRWWLADNKTTTTTAAWKGRKGKQQSTNQLCCFSSPAAPCSSRNCPCAKAGRHRRRCSPWTCGRCSNTIAAHNRVIQGESFQYLLPSSKLPLGESGKQIVYHLLQSYWYRSSKRSPHSNCVASKEKRIRCRCRMLRPASLQYLPCHHLFSTKMHPPRFF